MHPQIKRQPLSCQVDRLLALIDLDRQELEDDRREKLYNFVESIAQTAEGLEAVYGAEEGDAVQLDDPNAFICPKTVFSKTANSPIKVDIPSNLDKIVGNQILRLSFRLNYSLSLYWFWHLHGPLPPKTRLPGFFLRMILQMYILPPHSFCSSSRPDSVGHNCSMIAVL